MIIYGLTGTQIFDDKLHACCNPEDENLIKDLITLNFQQLVNFVNKLM